MKALIILIAAFISIPDEWHIVSENGPEPRYVNQMIFVENSLVLYGGKNNNNNGFNDLWEWKNNKWQKLATGPIKIWDHSLAYMKNADLIFLFGGRTFKNIDGKEERLDVNDSWIYKNNKWTKLNISEPQHRSSHCMVYKQNDGKVILFGGRNKDEIFNDTWSFNGNKWSKLEIKGPSKRYGHTLSYNPITQKVYLFGGFDGKKLLNDFWVFDGEKWEEINSDLKPSSRMAHAMQFNNEGKAILFGGWDDSNAVSGELWIWDKGKWNMHKASNSPEARLSFAIGYDKIKDEFILFGGSTGFGSGFLSKTWRLKLGKKN